jgi:hypothetical protein
MLEYAGFGLIPRDALLGCPLGIESRKGLLPAAKQPTFFGDALLQLGDLGFGHRDPRFERLSGNLDFQERSLGLSFVSSY